MTSPHTQSLSTPADARAFVEAQLTRRSRFGYVALLLAASLSTIIVFSLWLTEPALPFRTRASFGLMTVIGLSWMALSSWVMTTRSVLLGRDRVVAGRMAVTFAATFVASAVAQAYATGAAGSSVAAAMGVVMLAVAVVILIRAHRRVARLVERRRALERELSQER